VKAIRFNELGAIEEMCLFLLAIQDLRRADNKKTAITEAIYSRDGQAARKEILVGKTHFAARSVPKDAFKLIIHAVLDPGR
jgi:hypothetical protein